MSGSLTAHSTFLSAVDLILDILLPSTDQGVVMQLVVVVVLFGFALWKFWRNLEARLLTTGLGLVVLALMGLRALH
jgi:hypothetical protein